MKKVFISLSFLFLASCASSGAKPNSDYKNILRSGVWADKFTGKSSCYTSRQESYIDGLISYNLGRETRSGNETTLVVSDLFKADGIQYIGVNSSSTGAWRTILIGSGLGYQENEYALSYWNYGDKRNIGPSLRDFYLDMTRSAYEIRPKPMVFGNFDFMRDFLLSEENILYVRIGGQGGKVIEIDRDLLARFLIDCNLDKGG